MNALARPTALAVILLAAPPTWAAEGFRTTTFGNAAGCVHRGTLTVDGALLRFDVSALAGADVRMARLRVPPDGHTHGATVRVVAVGIGRDEPLALLPPDYAGFDATDAVAAWAARPAANRGLRVVEAGGVRFAGAVLEVSTVGEVPRPIRPITRLRAVHRSGQTFLTWGEIADPVGADAPTFGAFDEAVLTARKRRRIVYRVYRHDRPITPAELAGARLVREVPEAVSCWNLLAVRNTEHPNQGTPTKRSSLRPGRNLGVDHVMTRYRIAPGGEPLPRATGLAVVTAARPGRRYYAVTAAIDGREAVAALPPGASLVEPVAEAPATFPATILQETRSREGRRKPAGEVDVYASWLGPPYHNLPIVSQTFVVRWADAPAADPGAPGPLLVVQTTHGGSATEAGSLGWHAARRHAGAVPTVALTEGGLWQGFHECIGTLRSYADGVVHNYPQRRVLAATRWALARGVPALDPNRAVIWGQMAHWALRHGDLYAAVMSNGYANLNVGKEAQKHGWKWGPYPAGSRNAEGVDQWLAMNLPRWIRENPTVELPYWLCWPAYGAYPSHTIGDFGFLPWPEMLDAMARTKRAFAATWSSNGPGPAGALRQLVTRIRRDQSLPAFGRCSLDRSPGDGDHRDAEKRGGINLYQLWEPETLVETPDRWEVTLHLRDDCPREACTTDVTPRRCTVFGAEPGRTFRWTLTPTGADRPSRAGRAEADRWGLVTVKSLTLTRRKARLRIERADDGQEGRPRP